MPDRRDFEHQRDRARDRLGPDFARQWDLAQAMAASSLEALAWERGVTGIEEPVYAYGKFSHMRRRRSDSIFRLLLQASNPGKYGRQAPAGRTALGQWEREAIAAAREAEQIPQRASMAETLQHVRKTLKAIGLRPGLDFDDLEEEAPAPAPPEGDEEE